MGPKKCPQKKTINKGKGKESDRKWMMLQKGNIAKWLILFSIEFLNLEEVS